jgi:hypothetical protein
MPCCSPAERNDIVIGTPIANRTRREIEPLIGFRELAGPPHHDRAGHDRPSGPCCDETGRPNAYANQTPSRVVEALN